MTLGRAFTVQEGTPGNPQPVVVISDRLWRQQFGRAGDVIGRTVRLNARPFTIVGVAAPGFDGHRFGASDLWVPLATHPDTGDAAELFDRRNAVWQLATARLKPGVTLDQAQAEMTRIAQDLQREHYFGSPDRLGLGVMPSRRLPPALQTAATAFVSILFVFVGLILLVACTNVGGMLLARGVSRTREVALRLALGATRGRITRLLLTEGVVLASAAAGAGIAGAWVAINALQQLVPVLPLPVAIDFRLDWRVIAFSFTVSGIAAVLAGLAPALRASRHVAATPLIGAATSRLWPTPPAARRPHRANRGVPAAGCMCAGVGAIAEECRRHRPRLHHRQRRHGQHRPDIGWLRGQRQGRPRRGCRHTEPHGCRWWKRWGCRGLLRSQDSESPRDLSGCRARRVTARTPSRATGT